jgi:hypothetical protein
MLQAKEHAPTPSPSIVFIFGLVVESIKELGGVSKMVYQTKWEHRIKHGTLLIMMVGT